LLLINIGNAWRIHTTLQSNNYATLHATEQSRNLAHNRTITEPCNTTLTQPVLHLCPCMALTYSQDQARKYVVFGKKSTSTSALDF
jgi:hypothetical protein